MMIFMFSQSRAVLIALEALTALFMMTRAYDGAGALSICLVLLIGSALSFLIANAYAGILHHRYLLVLYALQRPEEFVRAYEPLLACKWIPKNVRCTLTAYLSNGYAAKGDFSRARELLESGPVVSKRQAHASALILCGNRASIALAEGAQAEARAQLERMEQLLSSSPFPAKKLAAQQTIFRTQTAQLHILSGDAHVCDCDALREESKKPGSALRKTELNYFIGRAYAQLEQMDFAKEYLSAAAESRDVVWGRLAAAALKSLRAAK